MTDMSANDWDLFGDAPRISMDLEDAIRALALRPRRPADIAELIADGDRMIELLASASRDELVDLDEVDARAVGYLAGLVLTLRQALRHQAGPSARGLSHG